ncbi:MAG TPA: cation diffusion facilitator family transporter [Bacilli bacterium]|nr:cation diffusion facilitator family transporter [Bacilli bacterium]HPS18808.1 cation diffusion facilitator family transporter [Bacilli bacterium]
MVNLLRKIFIKDYRNTGDPKVRRRHGYLASIVGIITNLSLVVFKLTIGILVFSMSIITDALNNFTDMASSIVNLFGFKLANKPADKEHPFGHERIEYIAGLIISFVIIAIAVVLGYTSVMKIINNTPTNYSNPTVNIAVFIILGVAIITKLLQGLFYRKMAKIINSVSLKASAQDSFNDVITTSAVLIATLVEFILYLNGYDIHIDGYMGLAVSIFIIVTGIKLLMETSNPLIGLPPDQKIVHQIVDDILSYPGVLGVHDMMCHSYGPTKVFMTLHVEVDHKVDVLVSHDMIDNIEKEIAQKYNILLTIHMDPIITDSPEINELIAKTQEIISAYPGGESLSFHDFRAVSGPTHTNILFDVVIPSDSLVKDVELLNYLTQEFKKIKSTYHLVINFDHNYVD